MKLVTDFTPDKTITCAIWLSDQLWHPLMNEVSVVGVRSGTETYILPFKHHDAGSQVISKERFVDIVKDCIIQTNDKKTFLHLFGDVATIQQLGEEPKWGHDFARPYLHHIDNVQNAYQFVPLTKIAEWLELILDTIDNSFSHVSAFFNHDYIPCLVELEKSGIHVDIDKLKFRNEPIAKRYLHGNLLYTSYNPYTTTGRASNTLGINFSALNKSTGVRDIFTSRFERGHLLSIDFEAYHLRLIADDIGVKLPAGSIHTELAKLYFDTDQITEELYNESKRKTFEIIYGMTNDIPNIELFREIQRKRNQMWLSYNNLLQLPTGMSVEVTDANPSKVFNYYVQALEVVRTIPKLRKVMKYLESMQSKVVLYTYDSILLDVHPDEDVREIILILEEETRKFPVRQYWGSNYDTLKELVEVSHD